MYCQNCGAKNQDGAAYCSSCGSQLSALAVPSAAPEPPGSAPKKSIAPIVGIAAVVLVAAVFGVVLSISSRYDPPPSSKSSGSSSQVSTPSGATLGEQNALDTAYSYLRYSGFSYDRLVRQLEYEGYTHAEAVYAADHCGADWYEQAVRVAESYLKYSSYSKDGLIEQLEYEGFTIFQAQYAVKQVGY